MAEIEYSVDPETEDDLPAWRTRRRRGKAGRNVNKADIQSNPTVTDLKRLKFVLLLMDFCYCQYMKKRKAHSWDKKIISIIGGTMLLAGLV